MWELYIYVRGNFPTQVETSRLHSRVSLPNIRDVSLKELNTCFDIGSPLRLLRPALPCQRSPESRIKTDEARADAAAAKRQVWSTVSGGWKS